MIIGNMERSFCGLYEGQFGELEINDLPLVMQHYSFDKVRQYDTSNRPMSAKTVVEPGPVVNECNKIDDSIGIICKIKS